VWKSTFSEDSRQLEVLSADRKRTIPHLVPLTNYLAT
jgi:hypothetical protein